MKTQTRGYSRSSLPANISVFKKFLAFENHIPDIDPVVCALVSLMITWRNRATHAEDDRDTPARHKVVIERHATDIASRFRGLDSEMLLAGYEADRAPKFKEIASFINATNHFVEELERRLFEQLDAKTFLKQLIWVAISHHSKTCADLQQVRRKHLQSVWGKDASDKEKSVLRFLCHQGLSSTKAQAKKRRFSVEDRVLPVLTFDDNVLATLVSMTPTAVFNWITSGES
jgi:hypothetical protein